MPEIKHDGASKNLLFVAVVSSLLLLPFDGYTAVSKKTLEPKVITSLQQLRKLLRNTTGSGYYGVLKSGAAPLAADAVPVMAAGGSTPEQIDYSTTNVQVDGVDEGDTVKTDGRYIYSLQNNQIRITEAYPVSSLSLKATIHLDAGFSPLELFTEGDRLVVIGQGWRNLEETGNPTGSDPAGAAGAKMAYWWYPRGESQTVTRVYNIADRSAPKLEREITFDGSHLSSRRVGNTVYMIGRKYPTYFSRIMPMIDLPPPVPVDTPDGAPAEKIARQAQPEPTRSQMVPRIRDSRANRGRESYLPLKKIFYFPGFDQASYIMVGSFNLDKPAEPVDFKSYLGAGDVVYASTRNLYISAADYTGDSEHAVTHIYKFSIEDGSVQFSHTGEVPGTPLNQFSLDEDKGYFRIATTVNYWTAEGDNWQNRSWNNLYTLDDTMQVKGKLEHLAEGERIYSARFMGNKAYLVTYEQVDPLFVIDLSAPAEPKLLGALKIPGFSNYLHPYDETHLIGLGQETVASTTGGLPTVKGLKLSLFDVTDPVHPEELHNLVIGGKGSYSPAAYDHKAFWFDKNRKLLGFPIEETDGSRDYAADEWPGRVFQGAQIYQVSLDEGFVKKGAVTHLEDKPADYDWYHYVQRLLTIGDHLYTLSDARLRVNSLKNFNQTGQMDFAVDSGATE